MIGPRAYRVVFALVSLCLAVVPIVYFINHRYDGTQLWNVQGVPGVHAAVWLVNFISFYFLYPSTFNILEVGISIYSMCACNSPLHVQYPLDGQLALNRLSHVNPKGRHGTRATRTCGGSGRRTPPPTRSVTHIPHPCPRNRTPQVAATVRHVDRPKLHL